MLQKEHSRENQCHEMHTGMSDHCTVSHDVDLSVRIQKKPGRLLYQCKKGDIEGMKSDMREFSDTLLSANGKAWHNSRIESSLGCT